MQVVRRFFAALQVAIYGAVVKRIDLQQSVNFAIPTLLEVMVSVVVSLRLLLSLLTQLRRCGIALLLALNNAMLFLLVVSHYYNSTRP